MINAAGLVLVLLALLALLGVVALAAIRELVRQKARAVAAETRLRDFKTEVLVARETNTQNEGKSDEELRRSAAGKW